MNHERSPLVTLSAIIFLILGIVLIFTSYHDFSGNFYFNVGLIILGVIILLAALLSRVSGAMGLIVAGIWLIAIGLLNTLQVSFVYDDMLMAVVPIAAALLMFFGI